MEYKFLKDSDIIKFVEENLHLSYSGEKEVYEFFHELETIKKIGFKEYIKDKNYNFTGNKKQDTVKFIDKLRRDRTPIKIKSMNKVKGLSNQIKGKNIKVIYPENLEGDSLTLNITLKTTKGVEDMIKHLIGKEEELKKLIKTIQQGG